MLGNLVSSFLLLFDLLGFACRGIVFGLAAEIQWQEAWEVKPTKLGGGGVTSWAGEWGV
jgi:hypothetical protein